MVVLTKGGFNLSNYKLCIFITLLLSVGFAAFLSRSVLNLLSNILIKIIKLFSNPFNVLYNLNASKKPFQEDFLEKSQQVEEEEQNNFQYFPHSIA